MSSFLIHAIWSSKFGCQEKRYLDIKKTIVLHVRNGMNGKKCIPSPIVADSSRKNPEVGTVVPKNAISRVGVFLLNE